MKEYIENNKEIVEELLRIDNKIMFDSIKIEDLIKHASEKCASSFENALLIYDGNPITTLKIMNSSIENCELYPNHSYLGINLFLTNYKESITLSMLKNDFVYEDMQEEFENIFLVNAGEAFEEWIEIYPRAVAIAI